MKPSTVQFLGAIRHGCLRKKAELGRIVKAIKTFLWIDPQHNRVGDVERQCASGKSMFGPLNSHNQF